jgi:hypothetical protein
LVELHDGQGSFSNAGESTGPTFSKHDVPWQTNVHRTNLFVFTILREPLLHAISYYNFFHKHQVNDATEKKMKEHVWLPINSVPPCLTTRKDGGSGLELPNVSSDNETLPLLHHLLVTRWTLDNDDDDAPQDFASYNVAKQPSSIHVDTLSASNTRLAHP